jgi:hypothetical protein
MKQVFYPKYAIWIVLYAILFLTFGVSIGEILNKIMPVYDETKSKPHQFLEVCIQIGLIAVSTYAFREFINVFLKKSFNIYKNPDKFAVLIVAPTMFSQQDQLIKKIHHIWDF